MTDLAPTSQIAVLDAGGQYCHLIARKVRELGVYAEVYPSEIPASRLHGVKGIIISGGPSSVYEPNSPTVDPAVYALGSGVLGICYGLQLMAYQLGGVVRRGDRGEYGLALLDVLKPGALFDGAFERQQVWMSHRDTVTGLPAGFALLAETETCRVAAMADEARKLYGVQFHPEVVHTRKGKELLANFLFGICGCEKDWDPRHRVAQLEEQIRTTAGDRNVFFFVSGGVDSAVAYTLCLRALGSERVQGLYVDTGLMRLGETEFVRSTFDRVAPGNLEIVHAREQFLGALSGVRDPDQKRQIIGEGFVDVQERILSSHHFLDGHWVLGQGTIYPDTIESAGTAKASLIKTHHNRVAGIQELIEKGAVIEPLASFYKDEVREVGRELGLPSELLDRHPFPGPGLAIRCLCSDCEAPVSRLDEGWLLPLRSVGVQGDERSYRSVLALEAPPAGARDPYEAATSLINLHREINRVVLLAAAHVPLECMRVFAGALTAERFHLLRQADAIVRRLSHECGFDTRVWQFPVILIPLGVEAMTEAVVLRPVDSVDGMTAQAVPLDEPLLTRLCAELLQLPGLSSVFCDLTHKPPGTIEWE